MPIKTYQKGARRERAIVNQLKSKGWDICGRSTGSKSIIDLFAINFKEKRVKFIQVKDHKTKIYGKEKQKLEELKSHTDEYFVEFEVWITENKKCRTQ